MRASRAHLASNEEAARRGLETGEYIHLTCADDGTGMTPDVAERAFEPFFTTKETGKGTGLGLASVYGIVKRHQGAVYFDTAPGRGSTFHVLLPPATADEAIDILSIDEPAPFRQGPRAETPGLGILVVEDEPAVRRIALRLLRALGHQTIEAIDGHSGLAQWRQHRRRIDLVITDLVMPGGMSGLQLADTIQTERPELPIILASGYSNELIESGTAPLGPMRRFLPKPYDQDALGRVIASLPVHEAVDLESLVAVPG